MREVRHFAERFRSVFSKPQYQYFVTVLLGLMACEGKRTLSGVLSKVGEPPSLSGLSRFFAEAPWVQEALVVIWLEHFRAEMQRPVSIGEARREIQRRHRRGVLTWLHDQFLSGVHPETLFELFAA